MTNRRLGLLIVALLLMEAVPFVWWPYIGECWDHPTGRRCDMPANATIGVWIVLGMALLVLLGVALARIARRFAKPA